MSFIPGCPDEIVIALITQFLKCLVETVLHACRIVDVEIHDPIGGHMIWPLGQFSRSHIPSPVSGSVPVTSRRR
jgi:hypothetical protein